MPFPLPKRAFPTGREMADYLETYAGNFGLPVDTGVRIERLEAPAREGEPFVATAGDRRYEAGQVIVATGAFQRPRVPAFATELDPAIRQLHSSEYRNPSQLADGPVLVVGLSHSGADLAHEIAATHPVIVSGKSHGQIPVPLESRRGLLGLAGVPGVHLARRDARHADRPKDGARGQEGRRSPPPLAQARVAGRRRRARRTLGRLESRTASRCSPTGACSTSRTSCGAPASGATTAGSAPRSSSTSMAGRCSTAACHGRARPVLHGPPLPVLVHVDARPRRRSGCASTWRTGSLSGRPPGRVLRAWSRRPRRRSRPDLPGWCLVSGRVRDASTQAEVPLDLAGHQVRRDAPT